MFKRPWVLTCTWDTTINKASLVLCIARIIVKKLARETATCHAATSLAHQPSFLRRRGWRARLCGDQPEVRKVYYAIEFVSVIEALKLVTIEVESRS